MSRPLGVLLPTAAGYRLLYEVAGELCAEEIAVAESEPIEVTVASRLGELLPRGELVVACAAAQSFAVPLPAGLNRSSRTALTYAVEEHVPWCAEELTAQLVHAGDPPLAIAVRTSEWLPLLSALRAAGQTVETLVPAALLRLRGLRHGRPAAPAETWLVRDQEGTHAFRCEGDAIAGWRYWPLPAGEDQERQTAALMAAELQLPVSPAALITAGLSSLATDMLQEAGYQVEPLEADPADVRWLWQGAVSAERVRNARVNLAVASLASVTPGATLRSAAKQLLLSVVLLMSVAAGALWWRAERCRTLVFELRNQQVELFRGTFPGVAVPDAIAARFRSEHRRIVGERGGEAIPDLPQSVLPPLAAALAAHAAPFRSRYEELAINGASLELECEFRSHDEAVQMCEQLRQHGVRLESPQIHKLDDTRVGGRLRGRMTAAVSAEDQAP